MSTNNKWSQLSMQQRADLIKLYVSNGITSLNDIKKNYNSFADGGNTDGDSNNDTTPTEGKPTLEEFLQAKADSTRNAALEKSYTRVKGIEIPYEFGGGEKSSVQRTLEYTEPYARLTYGPYTKNEKEDIKKINHYLGQYYQAKKELEDNCKYGFNCIGTATDNYPEESRTVTNRDFDENFEKYGFQYVGMKNAKPGDIAKTPEHSMIYVGTDVNGNPLFNYSDGGITEYNYKKDARYPASYYGVYTYVGTPELIQKWTAEYEDAYNKKYGGRLNLFEDGGSKESRATLIGTVPFNPFKSFNRHYRGTNIYEADSFNDAFRQARIDEQEKFVYGDKVYSTELAPNPFVEAAKNWDTEGDLTKEDFRMSIIRNPQGVLEYYNSTYPKGKYTTANKRINSYDIPYMYSLGTKGMEDLVMNRYANHSIGDAIWEELGNSNLSYEQKLAILANSYHETAGWTALQQYGKGPASGIYMMEDDERNNYNNWLNENGLTDSYANQTKYVVSLFDNKSPSLKTAWDRAGDKQEEIRGYKDANEANKKGYRSAYNHLDYTTRQAFKDWKSNDLDATTKAFEGLFERAGVPALENRMRIAHILSNKYK